MKKHILLSFLSLFLSSILLGCGSGSSDSPTSNNPTPTPETTNRTVTGEVAHFATGSALSGINIRIGSQTTRTNSNGEYSVPVATSQPGRVTVIASGNGFSSTSETITIGTNNGATGALDIDLLPIAFSGSFNPSNAFTAQVPNSPAQVVIAAGSLVNSSGNVPTGNVRADLTPINPALDIDVMPGEMMISSGAPIASYGALTVDFTDTSGSELNLATGQTATIRIPVSNRGSAPVPATIPLFFFDDTQGYWVEEGSATLSADGTYYEGTVSHFSTWNADYLFDSITISGCVQDESGNKVRNALINMEGFDYNGATSSRSNSNGNFSILAQRNAVSLVVASTSDKVTNTIKIGDNESTASNVSVTDCLILGDSPLTVRLTWGQNPEDLDTHVVGPSGYHIWWLGQGSLSSAPLAQLDVDDVTSFGPEVFTALSFPEPGTYHYAIHHFAGSSTISASPARVELTIFGDTTVFFPPAGQSSSDIWWNVFDIIIDADGNLSINTINTWSVNAPNETGRAARRMFMPSKK